MNKKRKQNREIFIAGAEFAIKNMRANIKGSALRMFDIHRWQTEDLLKQFKEMK